MLVETLNNKTRTQGELNFHYIPGHRHFMHITLLKPLPGRSAAFLSQAKLNIDTRIYYIL